ncbi:MAG: HPP family protein [Desulfobacterales bacterium]
MKSYLVKDVMVPLSEYATVSEGATLFEAVLALEKAQEEFDHTKYRHRGVLVLDDRQRVIGKLSQLDVLRALEPKDDDLSQLRELDRYGFSPRYRRQLRNQKRMESSPLEDLCRKAAGLKVEDFMQAPAEGEYVEWDVSLEMAIHQLVSGDHLSLLATRGEAIVGILRLTDVFAAVFHAMKECDIMP